MNKCAALFLLCVAIGIHAATIDEARAQLDKLADIATNQSQAALKILNGVADGVRVLSQNVLASGTRLVESEKARLLGDIRDIVASANQLKVNITSCTASKAGVVDELTDLTALAVVSCVDRFTNQATTATSQGTGQLNSVLTDVFVLRNKLESCKPADTACINTIVSQITFQELDVPRRIQEQLDQSTNRAEVNRLFLSECGVREAEYLITHGGEVVSEIQKCADRLIDGKPQA